MDSKTAKVVDKALLRIEAEVQRLRKTLTDIADDIEKNYSPKKTSSK
jgi:hypothetical protein